MGHCRQQVYITRTDGKNFKIKQADHASCDGGDNTQADTVNLSSTMVQLEISLAGSLLGGCRWLRQLNDALSDFEKEDFVMPSDKYCGRMMTCYTSTETTVRLYYSSRRYNRHFQLSAVADTGADGNNFRD